MLVSKPSKLKLKDKVNEVGLKDSEVPVATLTAPTKLKIGASTVNMAVAGTVATPDGSSRSMSGRSDGISSVDAEVSREGDDVHGINEKSLSFSTTPLRF